MPSCRECGVTFSVHPNDQKILNYFDAPAPTLCATHSLQQRLAWRNERHLYKRTCELCKKDILAVYSTRSYASVLSNTYWYFETTYTKPQRSVAWYRPDGKDIVYCKPCYQEILS